MKITVFPSPQRTLTLCRLVLFLAAAFFALQALGGLVGIHIEDRHVKMGVFVAGTNAEQKLISDAQGNTIEAYSIAVPGAVLFKDTHPTFVTQVVSRVANLFIPLLEFTLMVLMLRIINSVSDNRPFVSDNIKHLQSMAAVLFLLPLAIFTSNLFKTFIYNHAVSSSVSNQFLTPVPNDVAVQLLPTGPILMSTNAWLWAAGFLVLVLSYVFTVGVNSQKDLQGLI